MPHDKLHASDHSPGGVDDISATYQAKSEKGQANGYASLDSGTKVPVAQLPDATTSAKGIVQLAGDLAGTAAAPSVASGAITAGKIADGAVTEAKIADGAVTTNKIGNSQVTYAKIQNVGTTSRALGRKTAGAGVIEELTLSELLDFIGSAAQGDILYRGATGWARLPAGTAGQFLKTQGAGADPTWANVEGGGGGNSTINYLVNGGFELWTGPTSDLAQKREFAYGWAVSSPNTTNVTISLEASVANTSSGTRSVKIERTATDAFATHLSQAIPEAARFALSSKTVLFRCAVKTSVANFARLQIVDDVGTASSAYHSGSGNWEILTVSRTLPFAPSKLIVKLEIAGSPTGTAYFDDAMLVEGTADPGWKPRPPHEAYQSGIVYIGQVGIDTTLDFANIDGQIIRLDTNDVLFIETAAQWAAPVSGDKIRLRIRENGSFSTSGFYSSIWSSDAAITGDNNVNGISVLWSNTTQERKFFSFGYLLCLEGAGVRYTGMSSIFTPAGGVNVIRTHAGWKETSSTGIIEGLRFERSGGAGTLSSFTARVWRIRNIRPIF